MGESENTQVSEYPKGKRLVMSHLYCMKHKCGQIGNCEIAMSHLSCVNVHNASPTLVNCRLWASDGSAIPAASAYRRKDWEATLTA